MAEARGVSGILGADTESPAEGSAPETQLDPTAAALAAEAAKSDPELAQEASAYFRKQSHLVEVQTEHLHEQRVVNLALLKLKRFGERLRVGLQLFFILVATAIGIGGVIMFRDAVHSHSVVIDPFEVSPDLAAHALSGRLVASELLDRLTQLQAATRSSAERRALSNAWTNELSIEIPDTGLSLSQVERLLKTRFGHDQHITGDLMLTESGALAFTVRGDRILPKTFTEQARNLDKLLTAASEYVFGQSQPGLWAAYLSNNDRTDDAIRFCQATYATADAGERPYLLNYWANSIDSKGNEFARREALPFYREAVRLKPDYWDGYNNIMDALFGLGDEEGVVREGEQLLKAAGGRPGRAPEEDYQNWDDVVYNLLPLRESLVADLESHGGVGANAAVSGSENLLVARVDLQLHDVEAAALRIKTTLVNEKSAPDVATATFVQARLAEEENDLQTAAREWDAFATAFADPIVATTTPSYICFAAVTYAKTGQAAKADVALRGNLTFVDCERFRGDVLDLRGDWTGAQEWYAKAVKLGPSLPSGYYSWGLALAKHGDLVGATAKLKDANQKQPHWADPLKAWGDVLVKEGNNKEALAKYDEALKYAPNWKQLKEVREAAAKQKT
jgi:tetratricopeptide (TPR) repeat protein